MATLKISDLSVGDWVRYDGKEYQVQCVDGLSEIVTLFGYCEQREESAGNLRTIPITAEILEKNGFSHNGKRWYTPELFTLEQWRDNWSIIIDCSCGNYVCEVCTIKYVHQLQHALRLAGVDKEINL